MLKRTLLFAVLFTAIWTGESLYTNDVQPQVATHLAVAAVNGGNEDGSRLRVAQQLNNEASFLVAGLTGVAALLCFHRLLKREIAAAGKDDNHA